MQKETRFKIRVLECLKALPNSWFSKIQQVSIIGTPDIVGVCNGYFVAIELKSGKSASLSALQAHNLSEISRSGGITLVSTPESWFKDREFLTDLANGLEGKVS